MKNPWMSAWLRAMNTTLSATQAFWTELMRGQTHGTKPDSSQDPEAEMQPKRESAPTPLVKQPAAEGETSLPESKASNERTSPPRTDSERPATAQKEVAAPKETVASTRSGPPKKKVALKKAAAPKGTAASKGMVSPKKPAPPKEEPEDSTVAKAKTRASAPKFQHPTNPDLTWSGRGRRPRWVTEALETGQTLEDLRVRKR